MTTGRKSHPEAVDGHRVGSIAFAGVCRNAVARIYGPGQMPGRPAGRITGELAIPRTPAQSDEGAADGTEPPAATAGRAKP
jgi:hypothetical protein